MSSRGKNLLEAFSNPGSSGSQPAAGSSSSPAPTAGPRPSSGSLLSAGLAPARGIVTLRRSHLQMLVLAQVVLLLLAFLVGRASMKGSVEAGAPDSPKNFEPAPQAPAQPQAKAPAGNPNPTNSAGNPQGTGSGTVQAQVDSQPRTAAEQALLDPRNVYTLKVVDYVYNDSSLRLARETLRYMSETHGLPACLTRNGSRLYILVGAAPRIVDLDELGRTVRQLKGPPPISRSAEFESAYVEKIDKVFQRK